MSCRIRHMSNCYRRACLQSRCNALKWLHSGKERYRQNSMIGIANPKCPEGGTREKLSASASLSFIRRRSAAASPVPSTASLAARGLLGRRETAASLSHETPGGVVPAIRRGLGRRHGLGPLVDAVEARGRVVVVQPRALQGHAARCHRGVRDVRRLLLGMRCHSPHRAPCTVAGLCGIAPRALHSEEVCADAGVVGS